MSEENAQEKQHWIVYPLGSKPKWPLAVLLGIQQYLTMFGATVLIPFIVGGAMKLPPEELKSEDDVLNWVESHPGGIGYVSSDTSLTGKNVKTVQVN